jgi:hypothetical protein
MFFIATLVATQLAIKPPKHRATVPDSSGMTLVEVQNDRTVPVTVYAQDSWGETELGVVPADSEVTLRVLNPIRLDDDIDFFVHPKGQPNEETGDMNVRRGDRIAIVVPARKR